MSIAFGWTVASGVFVPHGAAHAFLPGLMTNIGTALLLGVLFLYLQQSLSSRIAQVDSATEQVRQSVDEVRTEVEGTARQLSDLTAETQDLLRRAREEDEARIRSAKADGSFAAVSDLLRRGAEMRAITRKGLRVAMLHGERLRFNLVTRADQAGDAPIPLILINQESPFGADRQIHGIWSPGEGLPEVLVRMAEEMKSRGQFPGDNVFDAGGLLNQLTEAIELVIGLRERSRGDTHQLDPLIELLNAEWALTDTGLEHLTKPPYEVRVDQLLDDPPFRDHMLDKNWVVAHRGEFEEAWDLAHGYHKARRDQHHLTVKRDED